MDNFGDYIKKTYEFKKVKEQREKDISKERLLNAAQKKIQTTMIGSLSSIEKHLGFLLENEPRLKEVFDELRSEILDRGNTQIRNLENEFNHYEIIWKKYYIKLPVINKERGYE